MNPRDLLQVKRIAWMRRVEAQEFDAARRTTRQLFRHYLTGLSSDHNAITPPNGRARRDDHEITVSEYRLHGVAAYFQGVSMGVTHFRHADLVPPSANGISSVIKETIAPGLSQADQRNPTGR